MSSSKVIPTTPLAVTTKSLVSTGRSKVVSKVSASLSNTPEPLYSVTDPILAKAELVRLSNSNSLITAIRIKVNHRGC